MIEQYYSSFAVGKIQSRAKLKSLTPKHSSLGVSRGVPRLMLVPLVCAAIFTMGASQTWAAASSTPVPYKDSYVLQQVSYVPTSDGGSDQVYAGAGIASHGGGITVVIQVHIEPTEYDPFSNAYVNPFAGSETVTVANGDTLLSSITGAEVIPLPPSVPYGLSGSQTITGGTGRFTGETGDLTFTGLDFNDGTISVSTTGTISTVGSNK
jgi:hypothetical protein